MGFLDDLPAPEPAPPRRQHPWEPPDAEFPGNVPLDTSCSGGPTRSRWRSQARYASPREAYDASICQTETLPTLFTGRISPAMPTRSALGRCRASAIRLRAQRLEVLPNCPASLRSDSGLPVWRLAR